MTGTLGLLVTCAISNGVKGRGETPVFLKHGALAGDFSRMSEKAYPGWARVYARVLVPGLVRAGDPIEVLAALVPAE